MFFSSFLWLNLRFPREEWGTSYRGFRHRPHGSSQGVSQAWRGVVRNDTSDALFLPPQPCYFSTCFWQTFKSSVRRRWDSKTSREVPTRVGFCPWYWRAFQAFDANKNPWSPRWQRRPAWLLSILWGYLRWSAPSRPSTCRPRFSITAWKQAERLQSQLPITDNLIEGWPPGVQASLDGDRPTIWRCIRLLQKEEALASLLAEQIRAGQQERKEKRDQNSNTARLRTLLENFQGKPILQYLRGFSYNFELNLWFSLYDYMSSCPNLDSDCWILTLLSSRSSVVACSVVYPSKKKLSRWSDWHPLASFGDTITSFTTCPRRQWMIVI